MHYAIDLIDRINMRRGLGGFKTTSLVDCDVDDCRTRLHIHQLRPRYELGRGGSRYKHCANDHVGLSDEFFGVAAVEAMAAGAVPVFPNSLSYPELIPDKVHADVLYDSEDELDELLRRSLGDEKMRKRLRKVIAPAMKKYSWNVVGKKYDDRLTTLA